LSLGESEPLTTCTRQPTPRRGSATGPTTLLKIFTTVCFRTNRTSVQTYLVCRMNPSNCIHA
jgi:hypothetical protein